MSHKGNIDQELRRLVAGCSANERPAQEALYRLLYPVLIGVCRRYFASDDLAQEALNTGMLKIFQQIDALQQGKERPLAWIKTIIIRNCIDLLRAELRYARHAAAPDTSEPWISPEALANLHAGDLLRSIRLLPPAMQTVFNLYLVEGYTHAEIAELLGIAESTSRYHLAEARRKLKTILTADDLTVSKAQNIAS